MPSVFVMRSEAPFHGPSVIKARNADSDTGVLWTPPGANVGDLLVIGVSSSGSPLPNTPTGWVWAATDINNRVVTYAKIAVAGDLVTGHTVPFGGFINADLAMVAFTGPSSATPNVADGHFTPNVTSVTTTSMTTTAAATRIVNVFGGQTSPPTQVTWTSFPAGNTVRVDTSPSSYALLITDEVQAVAGATVARTAVRDIAEFGGWNASAFA